jgi:predicted transcriptional regulator
MTAKKNRWRRDWAYRKEIAYSPRDWRRNQIVQLPRRQRQLKWLQEAREIGITLQVQGGVAYNRDLRDLVGRGLLRMVRSYYDGLHQELSRARLLITDRGLQALLQGKV